MTSGTGVNIVVRVSGSPEAATVRVNDGVALQGRLDVEGDGCLLTLRGASHRGWYQIEGSTTWVCVGGETWSIREVDTASRARGAATASNDVRSPMPGTVVRVPERSDPEVHVGETLVVVSAMKMEHVLVAPRDGTVDILVREGDSVVVDEIVARVNPRPTAAEFSS